MSEKRFYEVPTQVVYWDVDGDHWVAGVAYRDEIICSCCGGIVEIDELYEFAPAEIGAPIREYDTWVDIGDAIIGGELPESLEEDGYESDEEECAAEGWYFADLQDENKDKVD